MDLAADNEVRNIVILAPTGSGKSTLAEGLVPWIISEEPGPMMYASQTDPDAKFWAETRLQPMMKQCEPLKDIWPKDRHKSRAMEIIFPHMFLILGGANESSFQEKSIRWLYGDEVWAWKPGLVREFLARHHNRWNRKIYLVSQGGFKDGELDGEWQKTDQGIFSFPCPSCDTVQPWRRQQLQYEVVKHDDGEIDEQGTADTVRYRCVNPECAAEFADKTHVRRGLATSGRYVSTSNKGLRGFRGFRVHALAIWWIPWAEYVLEKLAAEKQLKAGVVDRWRQLLQKRDAEMWSDDMADQNRELKTALYAREEFETGDPIEGEVKRFATVDVGGDHFWCVIRAWKQGGASCCLWEGYVPGRGGDEKELADLMKKYKVTPSHVFVDTQFDQERVFELCGKHGWTGIKGDGKRANFRHNPPNKPAVDKLYSTTCRAKTKSGAIVKYIFFATNPIKDILQRLSTGQGAEWELPSDLSKAYAKHFKAERREEFKQAQTGEPKWIWVQHHKQNHLWDCEAYQIGAALIFGLFEG
jgi:phage terminase large subunit GpA-like protein